MPVYNTATAPVDTVQQARAEISQLVDRMTAALDAIAEAAGADRCPYCGEWTLEIIEIEGCDEFGRYQEGNFCRRCVPGRN
jgi:hypothetical protein